MQVHDFEKKVLSLSNGIQADFENYLKETEEKLKSKIDEQKDLKEFEYVKSVFK